MPREKKWFRLTDQFRATFDWKKAKRDGLTLEGLRAWASSEDNKSENYCRPPAHRWRDLRIGRPIPGDMLVVFLAFLSDKKIGDYILTQVAEACNAPAPKQHRMHRPSMWKSVFSGGWLPFLRWPSSEPETAYCEDEADIEEASRMIVQWVGRLTNKTLPAEAALLAGECTMKQKWQDYAKILRVALRRNSASFLFVTERQEDGSVVRVGGSFLIPLENHFFEDFRGGVKDDCHLTLYDIQKRSAEMLIGAFADSEHVFDKRLQKRRRISLVNTFMHQLASVCVPLSLLLKPDPRILAIGAVEEYRELMRAFFFRPVGSNTPVSGFPVWELAPPCLNYFGKEYPLAAAQYIAMKAVVALYQARLEKA